MSFAQKFKEGFLEKTGPGKAVVPDDVLDGSLKTPGTTGDPGDMSDFASLDMVAASVKDDNGLPRTDLESEPVRLLSGALDFLGDVAQEGIEFIVGNEQGEGHARPVGKPQPITIQTAAVGTEDWRVTVFTVSGEQQIVRKNPDRRKILFVNYGPGVVYISHSTRVNVADPSRFTLPVSKNDGTGPYSPVELETTGEVWSIGTGGVVEVMEVFGVPDAD
jgi:hypothetical protein